MAFEIYKVVKEEKIAEVAAKFNISVEELKRLNPHVRYFTALFGPEYIGALQDVRVPYIEKIIKKEEREKNTEFITDLKFEQRARYRCEQTVVTKVNGIIQNHADTKREFVVKKQKTEQGLFVSVNMVDNIIEAYQQPLEEAIKLVSEIDKIKCDVVATVSDKTGKIASIINHDEIFRKWVGLKQELKDKYAFLRDDNARHNFNEFIHLSEIQILKEENLINDLKTKLFFDVFFDHYLVSKDIFEPYTRKYYSQLFDGYETLLNFKQDILSETSSTVQLRKVSTLNEEKLNNEFLEKKYDEKFKPMIKYKYSEFNFSVRERVTIDTQENWINQSEITIIEEVKNNIQVLITYKLTKIE